MPLFVADPARCRRDGVCVAECPVRIIALAPGDETPHVPGEAEDDCRRCGHCMAVCRTGAVSLAGLRPEQLLPLRTNWLPGPDQVAHFLRARRSIRAYLPRPVERELLLRLLDSARYAPSASNRQAVSWLIVADAAEVRRLAGLAVEWLRHRLPDQPPDAQRNSRRFIAGWEAGLDMVCRGAPHLAVACAPAEYAWAAADAAIALTYLELAAPSLGLGACWAGILTQAARQWPPLQAALALSDGLAVSGALLVGYPRHRYHRLPERHPARILWRTSQPAAAPAEPVP